MNHAEYLFTVGEIGIAFAGFAGLVTVIEKSFRRSPRGATDVLRLRNVIAASMLLVLGSLLPYASEQLFQVEIAWSFSSVMFGCLISVFIFREVFTPTFRMYRKNLASQINWLVFVPKQGLLISANVALLFAPFLYASNVQSVYVVSIYALLLHAAISLVRLFISLASEGDN